MSAITTQIAAIQSQLEPVYPADEAEALAWWIAEEMTGLTRTQLLCDCKDTTFFSNVQEIIDRLLRFEPIQYIFGHTLWCGLDLKVTPEVLIPRPETAELVEKVSNYHFPTTFCGKSVPERKGPVRVLDLCTGSGCIAIALKKQHPNWEVTGIDISPEAIEVAKENAVRNGVEVEFLVMDITSDEFEAYYAQTGYPIPFDIIVSNPPYVCESEKANMRRNVLDYEPHLALFVPDENPIRFYLRLPWLIIENHDILSPLPTLFFEVNEAYQMRVAQLYYSCGFKDIELFDDTYGKPRFIQARSPR
ncbi:MAG: peptide chain release factor N(5)-glutamine methyltransferase [Paludibacteraceae bacterium]|nr:peptide chain release factor N(5)-glutamine methyltransferase [Paludibacteraceae bacterium]